MAKLSNWLLSFSFDCISNKGLIGFHLYLVFSRFLHLTNGKAASRDQQKSGAHFFIREFGGRPLSKLTVTQHSN